MSGRATCRDHRSADVRLAARAAGLATATLGGALLLGRLLVEVLLDAAPAAARPGPAGFDAWIVTGAATGALVVLTWWSLTFTAAVAAQARVAIHARQASDAVLPAPRLPVPPLARRLAAAALGVTLAAGPVAAHAAVDRPAAGTAATGTAGTTAQDDRAARSDPPDRHDARRRGSPADRPADRPAGPAGPAPVVVRPGDTLWSLAAARLGGGDRPSPQAVAAEWPRWWRANRAVVGPDPDLIRPGQVLHPPALTQEDR